MQHISWVYCTTKDQEEAKKLARQLCKEQLIACANILPEMCSVYQWEGEIQEAHEAVLIIKTCSNMVEIVTERIIALHSYDCPCVMSLPIESGNNKFIQWVNKKVMHNTAPLSS